MPSSATAAPTTESLSGPQVRQFSVFLQNKVGALLEVVKLLDEHNVAVLALSIQDSSESAIARMIVSDPDLVHDLFEKHSIPFGQCAVLIVEMRNGASDLAAFLAALLMAEVNVIFSYPLLTRPRGRTVVVVNVDDLDCATSVLHGENFVTLSQSDLSR